MRKMKCALVLKSRGPNTQAVNTIERAAGGDPSNPTPYTITITDCASCALSQTDFQNAGATAECQAQPG
jgi:hypothetical protein